MQVFLKEFVGLCRALRPDIMFDRVMSICGMTAMKTRLSEQAWAGRLPERIAQWREMEWCQSARRARSV